MNELRITDTKGEQKSDDVDEMYSLSHSHRSLSHRTIISNFNYFTNLCTP